MMLRAVRQWSLLVLPLLLLQPSVSRGAGDDLRLVEAVQKQDTNAVRALLKQGADVNARQPDGVTALAWAVHWNDVDTVSLLIRAGANVNAADDHGVTPLMLACTNGSVSMVKRLLQAGANPNVAAATTETALIMAVLAGNPDVVRAMVAKGADVNARTARGDHSVLMWAAAKHVPEIVQVLISAGADVHARSKDGFSPLMFAVQQGDLATTRIVLDAGAKINDAATDGSRPLTLAIASDHDALTRLLLDQGADPDATDGGYTALHVASFRGKLELVKTLLAKGVNVNARVEGSHGKIFGVGIIGFSVQRDATPLYLASKPLNLELMRVLLEAGADPRLGGYGQTTGWANNIKAAFGPDDQTTPLMVAAGLTVPEHVDRRGEDSKQDLYFSSWDRRRAVDAVKLLMKWGADVNAKDQSHNTALHGAAAVGAGEVVQLLVANGANLNARDKDGQTPFRIAQGHQGVGMSFFAWPETADLLRTLGADTNLGVDFRQHASINDGK